MSSEPLIITIPQPLAKAVRAAATARGLSVQWYAIRVLEKAIARDRAQQSRG